MSNSADVPDQVPTTPNPPGTAIWPRTKAGRWAIGLTVIGIGAWVALPLITITFRETYPVTDTWIMPAVGTVLIDLAAVFNLLCVWRWRERSVLNIVAAMLSIPMALFFTCIVVGESLGGA
jgi:hypothetical protein